MPGFKNLAEERPGLGSFESLLRIPFPILSHILHLQHSYTPTCTTRPHSLPSPSPLFSYFQSSTILSLEPSRAPSYYFNPSISPHPILSHPIPSHPLLKPYHPYILHHSYIHISTTLIKIQPNPHTLFKISKSSTNTRPSPRLCLIKIIELVEVTG